MRSVRASADTPTLAQTETLGLLDRNGPLSIAEMPTHLQVKLLRAVQDREIQRVGGEKPFEVEDLVRAIEEVLGRA